MGRADLYSAVEDPGSANSDDEFWALAGGIVDGALAEAFMRNLGDQQAFDARQGRPTTFDRAQLGRPKMNPIEIFKIYGLSTTVGAGQQFVGVMQMKEFDRPVIIWPCPRKTINGASQVLQPIVANWLYAVPVENVDPGAGAWPTTHWRAAIQSTNSGVLYLPAGKYYLYYPDTTGSGATFRGGVDVMAIDGSDPVLALWYLSRPGAHVATVHPNQLAVPPAVQTTILSGNRDRKACWIQNVTGDFNFGAVPVAPGGAVRLTFATPVNVNRGIRLPPIYADGGQHMPLKLAGSDLFLDDIYAISEDAATTCEVSLIETV